MLREQKTKHYFNLESVVNNAEMICIFSFNYLDVQDQTWIKQFGSIDPTSPTEKVAS